MPILYHIRTLPVLLENCPSLLLSLTTCVMYMYYIGRLSLSGYNIVLLRWSPGVFFAVPPLTFVISAAHAVSVLAARRVLRSAARGELLGARSAIMQRLWAHRPGMISLLSCDLC